MSFRYVNIKPLRNVPPFRKTALATWHPPGDPSIYGTLEVDLTKAYEWRDSLPPDHPHVTVLHMVARALAIAMRKYPDLNGYIRFGRIYLREQVDMFFQVATEHESGRQDLTGVHIKDMEHKGVGQIATEMAAKVHKARTRRDTELQKTNNLLNLLPVFLIRAFLWLVSVVCYTLNIKLPGIPPDSFGCCMISNIGALGLDTAYAPLVPYSRVPVIVILGQAKPRPVVVEGKIEIREVVTLNATIDHRFCDGALLSKMVRVLYTVFDNPSAYFELEASPREESHE